MSTRMIDAWDDLIEYGRVILTDEEATAENARQIKTFAQRRGLSTHYKTSVTDQGTNVILIEVQPWTP